MKYGIIATTGSAPDVIALGVEAEEAGWDGFFTWDGISVSELDHFDPWVLLGALATHTERIRLGAIIFALARRRPWKVVREAITVDHLSNGRLVIPVGLGAVDDGGFSRVHPEETDRRRRAERLDETLEILSRAWTGEPISFTGTHYQVEDLTFRPRPVQQPRIPIWTVAAWPREKSMTRAARWDGIMPSLADAPFDPLTPDHIRDITAWMAEHRATDTPYDVILEGVTPDDDPAATRAQLQPLAEAGVTWWIESRWENATVESLRERIRQGPPRI